MSSERPTYGESLPNNITGYSFDNDYSFIPPLPIPSTGELDQNQLNVETSPSVVLKPINNITSSSTILTPAFSNNEIAAYDETILPADPLVYQPAQEVSKVPNSDETKNADFTIAGLSDIFASESQPADLPSDFSSTPTPYYNRTTSGPLVTNTTDTTDTTNIAFKTETPSPAIASPSAVEISGKTEVVDTIIKN